MAKTPRRKPKISAAARKQADRLVRTVRPRTTHKRKSKLFTTTHKVRSQWFRNRAAWPAREAPIETLLFERHRANASLPPAPGNTEWKSIGPVNIGGRMTSVVCHPDEPDRILAGAAGGGVWASDNAGLNWTPLWHTQDSLNVGSLAIDPQNPDTVYCGTGEANLSADSYPGVGLLRSTDFGATWHRLASSDSLGIPIRIGAIAVDPFDSDHLWIGGVGHHFNHEDQPGGLYESQDGGQNWFRLDFVSEFNYWCHAVVCHPTQPGVLWVTVTEKGSHNGIWRSGDDGETWEHLTNGLPSPELFDRTGLAIAPSDPDVLYALASDTDSGVLGFFRSRDGGDSWRTAPTSHFDNERQMSYNNTIVVHPQDETHVLCAGVDLHLSRNGGSNWTKVTDWSADRGDSDYAHADHHALLMPAADPGRVYDMNDGGMDVSFDGGLNWENRSLGLAATMYYDLDVAQSNGAFYGGGAQDNGTPITTTGSSDNHFDITGGDGGWLNFDPRNEQHIYASLYTMLMKRFRTTDGWIWVTPPETKALRNRMWMVPIIMDPNDSNRVFTGSIRMWRTDDDADSWQPVSGSLDASGITAIDVSLPDSDRVYAATENGGFFRSTDGGDTWSGNLAGGTLPGRTITRIKSSPTDPDRLLITVANFGHSHVFRSADGGLTWEDADRGELPDVPHHSLAIPTTRPNEVYVANDAGVFVSPDFGDSWLTVTRNLPNVSVVDIVYHDTDGTLTAATYGRSLWRIEIE